LPTFWRNIAWPRQSGGPQFGAKVRLVGGVAQIQTHPPNFPTASV
jgi:hypothetical protein